jgi:putative acetyltransferase
MSARGPLPGAGPDMIPDVTPDLTIERGDPKDPRATALLNASHALMQALFPPEDNFFLPIDALCVPGVHFFIARQGTRYLGCAALAERQDKVADRGADRASTAEAVFDAEGATDSAHYSEQDSTRDTAPVSDPVSVAASTQASAAPYGELKSMYVDETARGLGVAAGLLQALEITARSLNLKILKLETGDRLTAAQRLYARHGFEICGPFGAYDDISSSVFMRKHLT